ncbi:Lrp/AsnC family transcriptional regulator [Thomasclavelia sp.]|uniref:Lrp/AsnC family transcriptional regulator n=1 Tax=Thomasclavelia sp. TaxID=3025757 RepID=UPI0025D851A2|nr:Lrp/AsnC family transcriptional regulator [Thomasclavelia sp.]
MDENLLLTLLHNNARLSVTDLAMALNESEENVEKTISQFEKDKVICGYHTIINWDRTSVDNVMAMIQINATPEREYGYDRIAKKIYSFPEVDTMYLLSGSFEFVAIVKGHTMQEVARFVASKLAPLEGVTGTATMFVLKQYKNNGISFDDDDKDVGERLLVTP